MNTASLKNTIEYKEDSMAKFFREIGRADELGSGLRKTTKYTPLYSDGAKPTFEEGDVFKMQVLLKNRITDPVNDAVNDAASDAVNDKVIDGTFVGTINGIIDGAIDGTTKETKRKLSKLLKAIIENEGRRTNSYSKILDVNVKTLERYLKILKEHSFIYFKGDSNQTGGYYISSKYKYLKLVEGTSEGTNEGTVKGTIEGTIEGAIQNVVEVIIERAIEGAIEGATKETKEKLVTFLMAINEYEGKRTNHYAKILNISSKTLERYLKTLKEHSFIYFKGDSKHTGGYYISKKMKNLINTESSENNNK